MIKIITLCGQEIKYEFQRKNVKNINLRIKPDGSVHVSAGTRVSVEQIERFLLSKEDFILNAMEKFKRLNEIAPKPLQFENGEEITVLGEKYALSIEKGSESLVYSEDGKLMVFVEDETDTSLIKRAIGEHLADVCRYEVEKQCRKVYPEFKKYVPEYPTVKFRKMYTKWGICRPARREITFSYMLASAPLECIEYVVCHEFCHFMYPDHSKHFYAALAACLPDWKDRKKLLERTETEIYRR